MKTGKIQSLPSNKKFGFIRSEDGNDQIFFHASVVHGPCFESLEEGLEVEYEEEMTEKGLQATQVNAPQYRFLNPYNFVRPLDASQTNGRTMAEQFDAAQLLKSSSQVHPSSEVPEKDIKLLGRCQPPPHDRYVGLSGRIQCELEAVTPLFISDSEDILVQEGHKSYRFFRLDNKPALPATSLRGPIRAVFEAVTNSCFAIFKENKRLSYRLKPQEILEWVPARVEPGTDGKLKLNFLPGTSEIKIGRRPSPMYAAWVPQYPPKTPVTLPAGLKHGDQCAALIERVNPPHWEVLQLDTDSTKLPLPSSSKQQVIESGWLCITNQNIENKRNERYFFRDAGNRSLAGEISIEPTVEKDYNKLIDEYQKRHQDEVNERRAAGILNNFIDANHPAFSPFVYTDSMKRLSDGDLVYAKLSQEEGNPSVDYLIPVAVGRIFYKNSISDLLVPESLHACNKYEELCPTCRTFGWVKGAYKEKSAQKENPNIRTAYKDRLVFTHGKLISSKGQLPETPLAILSSPKPTTTRFYLMPQNGQPQDGINSKQAGYHPGNMLRGRKFHRHHGEANPDEYQRAGGIKDNQNRTVRDALKPGAKFCFTIEFSNLAPLELGALLWTLELEEKGCHRLGYAKPLGFGSAKVAVNELSILEPAQRYRSLDNNGWKMVDRSKWQTWVEQFKKAMAAKYVEQSFNDLPNVCDFFALLGAPQTNIPIHYPRSTRSPQKKGKNFEWFVGNNREPAGPCYALKLATEDDSLPLLDKDGNEV